MLLRDLGKKWRKEAMKRDQATKRDNLFIKELRENHRGSENALSSQQASKYLGEHGFPLKASHIGTLVNKLALERCLPICYINGKGYFWATSKCEIQATVADLQGRINALQEHIDHLNSFIIE